MKEKLILNQRLCTVKGLFSSPPHHIHPSHVYTQKFYFCSIFLSHRLCSHSIYTSVIMHYYEMPWCCFTVHTAVNELRTVNDERWTIKSYVIGENSAAIFRNRCSGFHYYFMTVVLGMCVTEPHRIKATWQNAKYKITSSADIDCFDRKSILRTQNA